MRSWISRHPGMCLRCPALVLLCRTNLFFFYFIGNFNGQLGRLDGNLFYLNGDLYHFLNFQKRRFYGISRCPLRIYFSSCFHYFNCFRNLSFSWAAFKIFFFFKNVADLFFLLPFRVFVHFDRQIEYVILTKELHQIKGYKKL